MWFLLHFHFFFLFSTFWGTNICIFSFSFVSGVFATSLYSSVSLMTYNGLYISVPVLFSVLDKDLSEESVMEHQQILFYCQAGRFDFKLPIDWLFKCFKFFYILGNYCFSSTKNSCLLVWYPIFIREQSKYILTEPFQQIKVENICLIWKFNYIGAH